MHRLGCGAGWHSITGGTRGCGFIAVSWNRWAGRNLKAHPFLTTVMGRDASHHFRVPRAHPAQPRAPPRTEAPTIPRGKSLPLFSQKDQAASYTSHNQKNQNKKQTKEKTTNQTKQKRPAELRESSQLSESTTSDPQMGQRTRRRRRPERAEPGPLFSPGGGRLGCATAAAARKGLAGALPQGGPRRRVGPGRALCRRPARGLPGSAARRGGAVRCARGCGAMGR